MVKRAHMCNVQCTVQYSEYYMYSIHYTYTVLYSIEALRDDDMNSKCFVQFHGL